MNSTKRIRVAIAGGGVAGLALALTLTRDSACDVELYEAARGFSETGAGISFWPRGWYVLRKLGIFDDLAKKVPSFSGDMRPVPSWRLILQHNNRTIPFADTESPGGLLMLHRADLQAVLLAHLASASNCRMHTNKRLVSYREPADPAAPITLEFKDGSTASCDVLLGADGLRSTVRQQMCAELGIAGGEPVWSGTYTYRALVDAQSIREAHPDHPALARPTQYMALNRFVVVYLINEGRTFNVVAAVMRHELEGTKLEGPSVREASREEVLEHFLGCSHELRVIFENVHSARRWAIELIPQLPTYVSGRVAILGDAAHAMAPWQAMGAGQGIEDAYFLGTLLADPTTTVSALPKLLRTYDTARRLFSQDAARRTTRQGKLYTLADPDFQDIQTLVETDDRMLMARLKDLADRIVDAWKWGWTTTLEGELAKVTAVHSNV